MCVIWQNGQLPLLEHPITCSTFLEGAKLVSVSCQDQGGRRDVAQILAGVARRLRKPIKRLGEMHLSVAGPLCAIVVGFDPLEHRSHLVR